MGFQYTQEKKLFASEWNKLSEQYREAGFDEAGIKAMRDFDWAWFKQRRTYENRTQPILSELLDNDEAGSNSALRCKYPELVSVFDENSFFDRFGWIDTIADPTLASKLVALSDEDKELLTLLLLDNYSQAEIAALQGSSQQAVSKRLGRIKLFLK